MFPLVETIKIINGVPQNLRYHKMRFEKSYYLHFKTLSGIVFPGKIDVPSKFEKGIVKLRLLYNKSHFKYEYSFYKNKEIRTLKPVFDDNIQYPVKYTNRSSLDKLLKLKEDRDDILIIKNGFITDSSFTNIVFYDGNKWYTPSMPLLPGTARERLIDKEKIIPAPVKYKDLIYFKKFKLINAFIDFEKTPDIDIKNIF